MTDQNNNHNWIRLQDYEYGDYYFECSICDLVRMNKKDNLLFYCINKIPDGNYNYFYIMFKTKIFINSHKVNFYIQDIFYNLPNEKEPNCDDILIRRIIE